LIAAHEEDLPETIGIDDAIRDLHQLVKAAATEEDPAPWVEVSDHAIAMFGNGEPEKYIRRKKMEERSKYVLLRALLTGRLCAHFHNGHHDKHIPGWAWIGTETVEHAWIEGRLPMSALLPDEWQEWSAQRAYLDADAFRIWSAGLNLLNLRDLQTLPPAYDADTQPLPIIERQPPDNPYVTLSQAVSWIAFNITFDRDQLLHVTEAGELGDHRAADRSMVGAVSALLTKATGGKIRLLGKYLQRRDEADTASTEVIPAERLIDFAQFDILYDGLNFGKGLAWSRSGNAIERAVASGRRDSYRDVLILRDDLMREFPAELHADKTFMKAFTAPRLAVLPGVGPVMGLDEALSWAAFNRPSNDEEIYADPDNDYRLIFPDKEGVIERVALYNKAQSDVLAALRSGDLSGYFLDHTDRANIIARSYWNSIKPSYVEIVYRGIGDSRLGAGSLVYVAADQFGRWRANQSLSSISRTFKRDDPASIAPWWSVNLARVWIATRIPSFVEYIASLETENPGEQRPYILQSICELDVARSDEGKAYIDSRRAGWPMGNALAHAGRELLACILAGDIRPVTRGQGGGREMRIEEFVGIGAAENGADWLDLTPQPVFLSTEVMAAFPQNEQPTSPNSPETFTDSERKQWIADQPQMQADAGYKLFRQQSRADGTKQKEFRKEWREVRSTKPGRPPRKIRGS
jgi:hypothetical protein